ncbi:hypothetical protein [Candidatus Palauibacter sp.]|uniref:hypothetical protein n=1 Tax=Candidatus Palauibacter sp. TaxID=3101350 RepID=UPI003B015DA5
MRNMEQRVMRTIVALAIVLATPAVAQEGSGPFSTDACWAACHADATGTYNDARNAGVPHSIAYRGANSQYETCMEDQCGIQ